MAGSEGVITASSVWLVCVFTSTTVTVSGDSAAAITMVTPYTWVMLFTQIITNQHPLHHTFAIWFLRSACFYTETCGSCTWCKNQVKNICPCLAQVNFLQLKNWAERCTEMDWMTSFYEILLWTSFNKQTNMPTSGILTHVVWLQPTVFWVFVKGIFDNSQTGSNCLTVSFLRGSTSLTYMAQMVSSRWAVHPFLLRLSIGSLLHKNNRCSKNHVQRSGVSEHTGAD